MTIMCAWFRFDPWLRLDLGGPGTEQHVVVPHQGSVVGLDIPGIKYTLLVQRIVF